MEKEWYNTCRIPSFPAESQEMTWRNEAAMLKQLKFKLIFMHGAVTYENVLLDRAALKKKKNIASTPAMTEVIHHTSVSLIEKVLGLKLEERKKTRNMGEK